MKSTPYILHKQNVYLVEDKPNMYLNHQYQPNSKSWRFIGYRCSSCGQPLRQVGNIIKHNDLCKVLNSKKNKKLTEDDES
jgi:hypothetical protein